MDANDTSKYRKRKRKSRDNTVEEKRTQRKEWKKRKQQAKRVKSTPSINGRNDGSEEQKAVIEHQKRTVVDITRITSSSQNSLNVHAPTTIKSKSLAEKIKPKTQMAAANSRSALMLRLAVTKAAEGKPSKKVQTSAEVKFRTEHSNRTNNDARSS